MKKQGEITVFLSLTIVCVLSLFLGLLESARTTGARLYVQMAADSAMSSVMSQYNRNLWDTYHLLFLETESTAAIEESFSKYMNFYLEQENLYPMKMERVKVTGMNDMTEDGGVWLEDSVLSYVKYRLPAVAGDLAGIAEDAANASKVGDFRELFDICRQTGKKTRKLECSHKKIEDSLEDMRNDLREVIDAADSGSRARFKDQAEKLEQEMSGFSELVEDYEAEIRKISEHREELLSEADVESGDVSAHLSQELLAYEQVEKYAAEQLGTYREMEPVIEQNLEFLGEGFELLEEERYEYVYVGKDENGSGSSDPEPGGGIEFEGKIPSEPDDLAGEMEQVSLGPDWDAIAGVVSKVIIPGESQDENIDWEKVSLLDKLEELFQGDLLKLILPEGTEVSKQSVSLRGIPSKSLFREQIEPDTGVDLFGLAEASMRKLLVNEYCFLYFDSFLETCSGRQEVEGQPLLYEQEYLLCGEGSDRENLSETLEKLLTVRGAMNLLYLLRSPEKQAEADVLAMAVSGGFAPVKWIMSFFILTMWAFGEAVLDVKQLMSRGNVPFWKENAQWQLELEELLAFRFLEPVTETNGEGNNYKDHMRVLFFLMDREERNYRMLDVIQWNMRTVQKDFAVSDCRCRVELETSLLERHLFLMNHTYTRTVKTVGAY